MSQAASRSIRAGQTSPAVTPPESPGSRRHDLENVYAPIEPELSAVEKILRKELTSETPFVDQLLEHSWLLGGKRIRPVFLLLAGASCGTLSTPHLQLAAALEMIHTATLVHDDVLDDAEVRRHRATANSTWGSKISILLGDYLFTHAFHVASAGGSAEAIAMLAKASNRVCEGEIRQNDWQGNLDLDEASYLQMIADKTAELCGAGCRIGAFLSGASDELAERFEAYGLSLGIAFQIIDDILDIVGSQENVGKTLGTDLVNQKLTLPVIHCLKHSEPTDRQSLQELLAAPEATTKELISWLERTDSIQYARNVAASHAQSATQFASTLERNQYSAALENLAKFVLERIH